MILNPEVQSSAKELRHETSLRHVLDEIVSGPMVQNAAPDGLDADLGSKGRLR